MNLSKFDRQARGKVVFEDGQTLIGEIVDYTSSWDNDDEGASSHIYTFIRRGVTRTPRPVCYLLQAQPISY